jgi:hypothetical protein
MHSARVIHIHKAKRTNTKHERSRNYGLSTPKHLNSYLLKEREKEGKKEKNEDEITPKQNRVYDRHETAKRTQFIATFV